MDAHQVWPAEWLRGVLELCILRVLAEGPTYGYAISTRLDEGGIGRIKGGTLYPLLKRFEKNEWVAIEWRPGEGGPGRKYYSLTASGHEQLLALSQRWAEFTTTANLLLNPIPADSFGERTS